MNLIHSYKLLVIKVLYRTILLYVTYVMNVFHDEQLTSMENDMLLQKEINELNWTILMKHN